MTCISEFVLLPHVSWIFFYFFYFFFYLFWWDVNNLKPSKPGSDWCVCRAQQSGGLSAPISESRRKNPSRLRVRGFAMPWRQAGIGPRQEERRLHYFVIGGSGFIFSPSSVWVVSQSAPHKKLSYLTIWKMLKSPLSTVLGWYQLIVQEKSF